MPPLRDLWAAFIAGARRSFLISLILFSLGRSDLPPGDFNSRVRFIIGEREFDFVAWTLDAAGVKVNQAAVGEQAYLDEAARRQVVLDYFGLVDEINRLRRTIDERFTDPAITDAAAATADLRAELDALRARQAILQPLAEAVLEEQIAAVLAREGFGILGRLAPPVSFHFSPLPGFLVTSPRDHIELKAGFDIVPGSSAADEAALEAEVEQALNVSALVAPLGGIGAYPTMVYETADINFIAEVGAHEWTHNYLTFRPLGLNYDTSAELRTMNETTASIVGKEIGRLVIRNYYPERLPPTPQPTPTPAPNATSSLVTGVQPDAPGAGGQPSTSAFDFRKEMRETRVTVDRLLAEGKILEAEAYMEARRRVFVEHGYNLRRLNQAYFAFHGAYADEPGAPGADPVGPAVRALRERSASLKAFVDRMAWMTSFEALVISLSAAAYHSRPDSPTPAPTPPG